MKKLLILSLIIIGCANIKTQNISKDEYYENYFMNLGMGHQVSEVKNNGKLLLLKDGSLWEIHPLYSRNTVLWLPQADINVEYHKAPIGDFKYLITNSNDNEIALAKLLID
tara:strand:- start:52 stop:384 length:333 start_codon:yes stop_codon:yes gene_type:complete